MTVECQYQSVTATMNSSTAPDLATDAAPKTEPTPVGIVTPLPRVPPLKLDAASSPASTLPSYSPPPDFDTSDVNLIYDTPPFMPHCGCCAEARRRVAALESQLALANQREVSGTALAK